ncbi:MAG: class I SAM-dependent methyltransferase [Candidatus Paceibacterota bacterium]
MQNATDSQRFSNVLGDEYDRLKEMMPHYDRHQEQVALAFSQHSRWPYITAPRILEIGPGTGITTKRLLEAEPHARIVAVDNEPKMITQLRANLQQWGMSERVLIVEAEIGDYLAGVGANEFHFVVSSFVLHNLESGRRNGLVGEIYRVLLPGGLFVNGDKYAQDDEDERALAYRRQISRFKIYDLNHKSNYGAEWITHYERDRQPDLLFIEGVAKKDMRKIGFEKVITTYREAMEAVITGQKPG